MPGSSLLSLGRSLRFVVSTHSTKLYAINYSFMRQASRKLQTNGFWTLLLILASTMHFSSPIPTFTNTYRTSKTEYTLWHLIDKADFCLGFNSFMIFMKIFVCVDIRGIVTHLIWLKIIDEHLPHFLQVSLVPLIRNTNRMPKLRRETRLFIEIATAARNLRKHWKFPFDLLEVEEQGSSRSKVDTQVFWKRASSSVGIEARGNVFEFYADETFIVGIPS